jgi:cyclic beta-1,2-glucan synthetase
MKMARSSSVASARWTKDDRRRHGLPLFGAGDWNDGINRVGPAGHGESTWLGFFLHSVLVGVASVCDARGDRATAARDRDTA